MFYTIYKTTNLVTGEFYVGQHTTTDPYDGYLGSGTGIRESILKYGKKNFKKEVLHIFDNFSEMDDKEIEIVNEEFLSNPLVLNRQGGGYSWKMIKSVVIFENGKWRRIQVCNYDPEKHVTPNSGTIRVFDSVEKVWKRIPSVEYASNRQRYVTRSTGVVSVVDLINGGTKSIKISEYDPSLHKKVLGGIVANVNGKLQYVTKEQFVNQDLEGCHKGKVTVLDISDGIRKHVTVKEHHQNPTRYIHNSVGTVTAFDVIEQKYCKISTEILKEHPERYKGTTSGFRTVWDIKTKTFKNIPKDDFDSALHKSTRDKKIICYSKDGDVLIDFWGSKQDFVAEYGETLYNHALKETKNFSSKQHHKFSKYIGCSFVLIDWKSEKT